MRLNLGSLNLLENLVWSPWSKAEILSIINRLHLLLNFLVSNNRFNSSIWVMHQQLVYCFLRNFNTLLRNLVLLVGHYLNLRLLNFRCFRSCKIHKVLHHLVRWRISSLLKLRLLLWTSRRFRWCLTSSTESFWVIWEVRQLFLGLSMFLIRSRWSSLLLLNLQINLVNLLLLIWTTISPSLKVSFLSLDLDCRLFRNC